MDNRLILTILYVFFFDGGVTVQALRNVKIGEYPFMAYLYYPNEKTEWRRFLEAAILITPEWLVSSAIDMEYNSAGSPAKHLTARMGTNIIDAKFSPPQNDDEQERQIFQVVKSREKWWKREINLLRTAIPFETTDTVRPVTLYTEKTNLEGGICDVLVYSQYINNGEDKHLIQLSVTILESDIKTCGKNFDERAMTCGQHVENDTTVIDPDFCQDNSGGPLICNGKVVGLQSYVDDNECRPPYFYQMFSAWNRFIACGLNDCEGDCDVICTSRYKDETVDSYRTTIISNTSSEKAFDVHLTGESNDMSKTNPLKTEVDFENGKKNLLEKGHRDINDLHEKQEQEKKEEVNTVSEKDSLLLNSSYDQAKEDIVAANGNEVILETNQYMKNNTIFEILYNSSTKLNNHLEGIVQPELNNNEETEYNNSSLSRVYSKQGQNELKENEPISEDDSTTDKNTTDKKHKNTSEDDQNSSENSSFSKGDKNEEVIKTENDNVEANSNKLDSTEYESHTELLSSENGQKLSNVKSEDNTSDSSENFTSKSDREEDYTELSTNKSNEEMVHSSIDNGSSVSEKLQEKHESEEDSTVNEANLVKGERETPKQDNDDSKPVATNYKSESIDETSEFRNRMLYEKALHFNKGNDENSLKDTKTKSENPNDNIVNESILSEYQSKSLKDGNEHDDQSESKSKHDGSDEERGSTETDNKASEGESTTIEQGIHLEHHTKGESHSSEESSTSNKEENSKHSTETYESHHSSHIIMAVTNVVIKTVEDLLYANRNNSRQYDLRTAIELNDTDESLTPKPKFGRMGRAMADHAESITHHPLLHCLLVGTVFDFVFVILF